MEAPRHMQSHAFLASVRDGALAVLPSSLQGAHTRIRYGMLQLHYGNPRIHYEVWLVHKTGRIEIGLHFEADREANHARATELAERVLELREVLGPEVELEEWTPSWTRLHLTLPLGKLDAALSAEVADKLASIVRLTGEQIASLPPRMRGFDPAASSEHGRHGRRRRGTPVNRGAGR